MHDSCNIPTRRCQIVVARFWHCVACANEAPPGQHLNAAAQAAAAAWHRLVGSTGNTVMSRRKIIC